MKRMSYIAEAAELSIVTMFHNDPLADGRGAFDSEQTEFQVGGVSYSALIFKNRSSVLV